MASDAIPRLDHGLLSNGRVLAQDRLTATA